MCARGASFYPKFTEDQILEAGFFAIETALDMIKSHLNEPDFLLPQWNYTLKKDLLKIDEFAQKAAEGALGLKLGDRVEIRGEESSLELLKFDRELACLLDMVDGTDLLERGFGNWCSAMTLFNKRHVWASLIGMPNGEIYYERYSKPRNAFVRGPRAAANATPATQTVTVANKPNMTLRDASIAFYGQKAKSLLKTARHTGFLKVLDRIAEEAKAKDKMPDAPKFRIYNLAGNPMMMKLIEGKVDAIVELSGQKCHDIIPGFAIALKGGAALFNLETSQKISTSDLSAMLSCPDNSYRYVMACSETLAREILEALNAI